MEDAIIRFLDSAGLNTPIYAIEVAGRLYAPEEVAAIIRYSTTQATASLFCEPAQNDCEAIEDGARCGDRTYAGRLYCKKHGMRFIRTGDPTLARKRGPKKKEKEQT